VPRQIQTAGLAAALLGLVLLAAPPIPQSSNDETTAANLLVSGKYREAVPYFTRLIARQPQNPYHYLNRAECYKHVSEHRAMTPPCGVPLSRGTNSPSSSCTGAFNQRSM
jgi:hypothetical protein